MEIGEVRLQTREHQGLLAIKGSQKRGKEPILPQSLCQEPTLLTL